MMTSYYGTMTSRVGDADLEGAGRRRLDLWEKSTADFRFQSKVRPTHATLRLPPRRERQAKALRSSGEAQHPGATLANLLE